MNWEAIGAVGETLGALGVIITLLYLSSQIRQNNRQIRGSAIGTLAELDYKLASDIRDNPDLFRIAITTAEDWLSATAAEQNQAHLINLQEFQILQAAYHLWQEKSISSRMYRARERYMLQRLSDPGTLHWWQNYTYNLDPAFISQLNSELDGAERAGIVDAFPWIPVVLDEGERGGT